MAENPIPTSPNPQISPPLPVSPPLPTVNSSTSSPAPAQPETKSKKNLLIVIGLALAILLLILGAGIIVAAKNGKKSAGTEKAGKKTIFQKDDLSKYNLDTDGDGFPDFIEEELGFDPKVDDYQRCRGDDCIGSDFKELESKQKNVLIVLDASGSMNLTIGDQNRMEIAKQAIKSYVYKASSQANVGLLIYGHQGSNSQSDKSLSCTSAEQIAALGTINNQTIDSYLFSIRPVGWTPTGLAIKTALNSFTGRENDDNEIILLSDGVETCDTQPVAAARDIRASKAKVKVHVIGFAVDTEAQSQLTQISQAGEGMFATASSAEELNRHFDNFYQVMYENAKKLTKESECRTKSYDSFLDCYSGNNGVTTRVSDYLTERMKLYKSNKISKAEFQKIIDLQDRLFELKSKMIDQESYRLQKEHEERTREVFGE
jgi:lipopolysaccharide export system protein LptC